MGDVSSSHNEEPSSGPRVVQHHPDVGTSSCDVSYSHLEVPSSCPGARAACNGIVDVPHASESVNLYICVKPRDDAIPAISASPGEAATMKTMKSPTKIPKATIATRVYVPCIIWGRFDNSYKRFNKRLVPRPHCVPGCYFFQQNNLTVFLIFELLISASVVRAATTKVQRVFNF